MAAKRWIQKAIKHPGALRAKAKRRGLIKGNQKLSSSDLSKLSRSKSTSTKRQANLAQTLRRFKRK